MYHAKPEFARVALIAVAMTGVPVVSFTSTNTAVAAVTEVGPGCAQIKATYTTSFRFKVPNQNVPWPGSSEATLLKTVSLGGSSEPGSGGTLTINRAVWSITSSNPAVAEVPANVTQVASTTSFPIKGKSDGCAIITARLGTERISRTVRVQQITVR